jgi:hypothetical protein
MTFKRNKGACQRDMVFYEFLMSQSTHSLILRTLHIFWDEEVRDKWEKGSSCKELVIKCCASILITVLDVFDVLLTRNLEKAHIVDFNPFAPKTDSLLFTYEELHTSFMTAHEPGFSFEFRVIDSPSHPYANSNAPRNQHNMVPLDALALSAGRSASDYATILADAIQDANNG